MKYLIAFQLHSDSAGDDQSEEFEDIPGTIYSIDQDAINIFGSVFDSNWIVISDLTAAEIRHRIGRLMGAGDKLIVARITELELEGFDLPESERLLSSE